MKPSWDLAPEWANYLISNNHEYYWLENQPPFLLETIANNSHNPDKFVIWINDSLPIKGRIELATTPYLHSWDCEKRPIKQETNN